MLKLIIGLGNVGNKYEHTRHNVGFNVINTLADRFHIEFSTEAKFFGEHTSILHNNHKIHLLKPSTLMNASGRSVNAICNFYRIDPKYMLVLHDDLDLLAGDIRLKFSGGHGGHNGLRDIMQTLSTTEFYRLRIGIGKPNNKEQTANYVLSKPSTDESISISHAIDAFLHKSVLNTVLDYNFTNAMQLLHTKPKHKDVFRI